MVKNKSSQSGFTHPILLLIVVLVIAVVGFTGYKVFQKNKKSNNFVVNGTFDFQACLKAHQKSNQDPHFANDECIKLQNEFQSRPAGGADLGDPNSTDPVTKGKALGAGCTGKGSTTLTHAPMDPDDIESIQPYGLMVGGHVTPVDHQYYWGKGSNNSRVDTYPVYADADGTIVSVGSETSTKWDVVISHNSCTFFSWYNLMTSLDKSIKSQLPANWGQNSQTTSIKVKSGQLLGYVGGQSLDFAVWNTEKHLSGLLYPIAYNNREPWKINTVPPLDYFSDSVKSQILPKYERTDGPIDGTLDYDVSGEAVGTWFLKGSNGYAGGDDVSGSAVKGHLALAYYYIDPAALVFSTGDYDGQPHQFAVVGNGPDWKTVTQSSGLVKYQLAEQDPRTPTGAIWLGTLVHGVKLHAGSNTATALIQLTGKDEMKVELFPGKSPSQVNGFDGNAKIYNRGQDAHMVKSNTAT